MFSNICSGKVRHYESLLKLLLLTRDLTLSIQRSYKLAFCTRSFVYREQTTPLAQTMQYS